MQTPEFQEKLKKGPILILTVLPNGPFTMGKQLTQWFVYIVVVSLVAAYVTSRALPAGASHSYLEVFRFAGVTAFAQPGGSLRDADAVAAADAAGATMLLTGVRHFRH